MGHGTLRKCPSSRQTNRPLRPQVCRGALVQGWRQQENECQDGITARDLVKLQRAPTRADKIPLTTESVCYHCSLELAGLPAVHDDEKDDKVGPVRVQVGSSLIRLCLCLC